jgi:site-specific recombinase XerC
MGLPIVGKLLGHANSAATARYAHLDYRPAARRRIARTNSAAQKGSRKPGAVVKLRA